MASPFVPTPLFREVEPEDHSSVERAHAAARAKSNGVLVRVPALGPSVESVKSQATT
jgi:hypothetical protein